jgi:hypothetical protein
VIPRDAVENAEAKQVAALYGIEIQTLVPVDGGFSGACLFRVVDTSGAVFALRQTQSSDAMPAERYCDLVALLRDVSLSGCEFIPVPLRHQQSLSGLLNAPHLPSFANVDESQTRTRIHKSVWQIEHWMPGEPATGPPTAGQIAATLEALALFHNTAAKNAEARANHRTLYVARERSPGISRRIAITTELSNGLLARFVKAAASEPDPEFRSCAKRLCAALEYWLPWLTKQLIEVASVSYQLQPVIRDLWRPHVLFTEEHVTGIIDLNAMATDHVGLDVTRLCRSWFGADVVRIREVISQFIAQRFQNEKDRSLVQALDASTVLLSPIRWLRELTDGHASQRQASSILARFRELTGIAEQFEPL